MTMSTVSQAIQRALLVGAISAPAVAQLADLQPGRNFPTATVEFGPEMTGGFDLADVDHDGDLDVGVANGMHASRFNRIYINQGGYQGATEGSFADETATRFVGHIADRSRDIEFIDYDADGDLDMFVTNEGTSVTGGGVCRAYTNQGGMQLGAIAVYVEDTDDFWGDLVDVPLGSQIFGGNHGPWLDYSQDASFADFDVDGDLDLFHSSWGLNINGQNPSRVFLNDGTGTFDELWPWADAAAEIKLYACDVDVGDLDADFDLDVFANSRDSQARVYRNNLDVAAGSWPGDAFTDVTQAAVLDNSAAQIATWSYEIELSDLDGDGDLDAWLNNYDNFTDRLLLNDGSGIFTQHNELLAGDPSVDEQEIDTLDYDGDGDLDVICGNFSGTNHLYQSGLADGAAGPGLPLFHRTGLGSGSAPWPEAPAASNGGVTEATETGDLDGDGDPDIVLINESGQQNRVWFNELGIPDTHAPTIWLISSQADKSDGSDTPLRVQLRDNSPQRTVRRYDVDLVYTVDGGLPVRVPMRSQRGWQFQASIPGGVSGTIAWNVEGRDDAGNAFVSPTDSFVQTSSGVTLIEPVGSGTLGVTAHPDLYAFGDLSGGSTASLSLRDAAPNANALLFLSVASTPLAFKGGWLHTLPIGAAIPLISDAAGSVWIDLPWPAGLPAGAMLWWQVAIADVSATGGASLSNAVKFTTP
jgi:hypothetical protein